MGQPVTPVESLEALIRHDPAGRGLISSEPKLGPLCPGHLGQAAANLAATAKRVAIVTGFFVPDAQPPAAETDGPPGAVLLAAALEAIGVEVMLVTDQPCKQGLLCAMCAAGISESSLIIDPEPRCFEETPLRARGIDRAGPTGEMTHLIAIERVGPSHDEKSLRDQSRPTPAPLADFRERVPSDHQDRCHNMRGALVDAGVDPLYRIFEEQPRRCPGMKTIGIGDGGNEIGMGSILWEDLAARLANPLAARTICRIRTDWTIVAGTSNWGAFALAAATLWHAGRHDALIPWDATRHRKILEAMVSDGQAVDGITRRQEPTVDGLSFETYIQTWRDIRRTLGLDD